MTVRKWLVSIGVLAMAAVVVAGIALDGDNGPLLLGIRAEFYLFALTLLGVALFHDRTLEVALVGLVAILALKLPTDAEFALGEHLLHEAPMLINLLGLLLGFAILARHF
ncbi:MAG: citrate transporter, partial [Gammaproteobacteria bacterium]